MLIVIRTCPGRAELLSLTLWSVHNAMLPSGSRVQVHCDGPAGPDTRKAVEQMAAMGRVPVELIEGEAVGIDAHAKRTIERVTFREETARYPGDRGTVLWLGDDCPIAADCLLRLQWAARAEFFLDYAPEFVGGYWGAVSGESGDSPHYRRVKTCSPIGLMELSHATRALADYQPGATLDDQGDVQAWDSRLFSRLSPGHVICMRRSVIQHVGMGGTHGWANPPAGDFVGFA